jgi:hypothetical protein
MIDGQHGGKLQLLFYSASVSLVKRFPAEMVWEATREQTDCEKIIRGAAHADPVCQW